MRLSACFRHFSSTRKLCNVPKLNNYFPWRQRRWVFQGSACPRFDELGPAGLSVLLLILPQLRGLAWSPSFPHEKGGRCQCHCSGIPPSLPVPSASPPSLPPRPTAFYGRWTTPERGSSPPLPRTGMQEMLPIRAEMC